ncbi:uncharacterized protein LOC131669530 isoform X2 [Phymastichus coffea]|uniref:uncharacterized protein LOC131669530 isoform X2 n=1 Tax=Phymastichus coffea TaxID=108790 RepID=UPI00273A8909|nr:uncharacterized protein LOC131669530 isoform X2 [Phymastichus coffea]
MFAQTCRSWLEQRRRERQPVLTITSLELPDCPVPLIDSLAGNRYRTADSRSANRDGASHGLFAKAAQKRARKTESWESHGRDAKAIDERDPRPHYEIESCCEAIANVIQGISSEEVVPDGDCSEVKEESGQTEVESKHEHDKANEANEVNETNEANEANEARAATDECTCSDFSEKLRINIRKKTVVRRSSRSYSPEVTHTIRIAMKCQEQRSEQSVHKQKRALDALDLSSASVPELQPVPVSPSSPSSRAPCCSGLHLALDFSLNCNGLQLISQNCSVRPIIFADLDKH